MKPDHWTPLAVMQFAVAAVSLIAVVAVLILSFFVVLPEANQRIVDVILGALLTVGFANIIGFLFGQKEQAEQAVRIAAATKVETQDVRVVNQPREAVPVEPTEG